MIAIFETSGVAKRQVATFPDFAAAETEARTRYSIFHFEADDDFEDCADFITTFGGIYSIEPVAN